ncbi:bifunctional hydroxymethylpyrimidine kinase/phosphomethylpyrimidine kinase [Polycladospora coralii]|uniref:bifunctional hydroxymethylpyrimidine kinase/phosphomethylpyrimidine kinase n=1 Tax=Polycladospora coralii TaxID=2771432 RepID=UPI001BCC7595|nr:bifunctional hydroxymethylpyrimidine kinase/phosphomethylpyrimidine kinase [Polycladospora coralii]
MKPYVKALTIAGSDSGGGAGIQADLKTFQERDVFGMSAITAVTAQNTLGVKGVYPVSIEALTEQIDAVVTDLSPQAIKTGMLFQTEMIEVVVRKIKEHQLTPLIVDPVMIAKGGASLLKADAIAYLKKHLLPVCEVVTPNIPEAEALTDQKIETIAEREDAAKRIHDLGAKYVVIKGGHDESTDHVVNLLYDGHSFFTFENERVDTLHTHGTGCTFAACLTAERAKGRSVLESVETATRFVYAAIADSLQLGSGHGPTNHWAFRQKEAIR